MVAAQKNKATATAVLLSAGSGTRFSGSSHKLLTQIFGKSVFAWSLQNLLEAEFQQIIIVTGAIDLSDEINKATANCSNNQTNICVIENKNWHDGMASSLQCGLAEAQRLGANSVVVGLADQPAVKPTSWRRVANSQSPIAVATYNGVRGNPVRLHAELWPLLPTTGDEGARNLFKSHKDLLEEVACDGSAQDLDTTNDIDGLSKLLSK